MASIRSSSHYDSITAEDLFDSFMNVALSVEKEIQPKAHERFDYKKKINFDNSKEKLSPNNKVIFKRENIYASCDEIVNCKDECELKQTLSSNNNKESSDMNNDAYAVVDKSKSNAEAIQTSTPIHETHLNDESQAGLKSSIDYTVNSSNPLEYELYAKPSKKYGVAVPGANLADDLLTDISTTSSEDKYDVVGSIISSSINYESLDMYNLQHQSKERPVATVAPMVHDYKIKVEDVAFNKRLSSAACHVMYKNCLETIEKGNNSALQKTDHKSKKNFFGFQRSNSKEKLYKDISKYNNNLVPKTEANSNSF